MNDWIILGIEKTNDLRKVKQAYAEKTKLYHPETHPDEFQKLHNAYKRIASELRRSTDNQQLVQVHKSEPVQEAKKQLEVTVQKGVLQKQLEMNFREEVHKPVRNIKQDKDFLKQVEDAAKNFEARHTDKRDPVQVAKVDYILQHDARNSKLLQQFQWLLYNEFFAKEWRNFFLSEELLERQYEPEFINGMTEILKSRILEIQRAKQGAYGLGVLEYFLVVYGDIFEGIDHLQFDKHIYQKELLQSLADVFPSNAEKSASYQQIEENAVLSGERYAFFLYRNILKELDADIATKEKIMQVIIEGFQKKDVSKVFFDLLLYLITSHRKNIPIFKVALLQVCEMEWDSSIQEEIEILKLELENDEHIAVKIPDLQEEGNIEQKTPENKTKTNKKQTNVKDEKFNRAFGKWMFIIAVIILCINVICRIADAGKSREYLQVMGTVTMEQTTSEWRAGKRSYKYMIWVDYQPQGHPLTEVITESYSFDLFSKGDTVPVLYQKDAVYKAYVAKKDWMTGAYLPVSKNYNIPLIISVILFVIGFFSYEPALI